MLESVATQITANFLFTLIKAVPDEIQPVFTDNGTPLTGRPTRLGPQGNQADDCCRRTLRARAFNLANARVDIAHRLTKPNIRGSMDRSNA
jgi:hypothetical protein